MINRLKLPGHSMINHMAQMEIISNNLANLSTRGFKRDRIFVNELRKQLHAVQLPELSSRTHVPQSEGVIDFSQGSVESTGRPLDLAISGEALFAVETEEGEAYTRDGRFTLSAEGILTTLDGKPVLGEGGPIEIDLQQNAETDIVVSESGDILINGSVIDTLKLSAVNQSEKFRKIGFNLYRLADSTDVSPAEDFAIKQGFLEDSNVDALSEMVAMIDVAHQFANSEKMIRTQDRLLDKAVNQIGRVS